MPAAHKDSIPPPGAAAPSIVDIAASIPQKPQACQACQQRKRKCDRRRPRCTMCEKRGIECVFEHRNANLLANLVTVLKEKDQRIAVLEALIRERLPDLDGISHLPTAAIPVRKVGVVGDADAHPHASGSGTGDGGGSGVASGSNVLLHGSEPLRPHVSPSDVSPLFPTSCYPKGGQGTTEAASGLELEPDYGSQPLSPAMVAFVEDKIAALHLFERSPSARQSSVVNYISSQLGVSEPEAGDVASEAPAAWPPYELAVQVVEVFVQTNSLWPIFRHNNLINDLEQVYQHGTAVDLDANATPLQTFKLFLIFSIACVWLAQRGNGDRIDTSLLRHRAMSCLPTVLRTETSVTCLHALALLCVSAIYDWGGPDYVQITPVVGEVAIAINLHKQPPAHLPREEKERRRLLFWGIYSMDRAVAGNLGRGLYFTNKDIITCELPSHVDPLGSLGEGYDPLAFFKHILAMWDLSWEVKISVQGTPSLEERAKLHGRLDEWYARRPLPVGTPTLVGDGTANGDSIFDQYHKMLLAMLYRPRNLVRPSDEHIRILQDSASEALKVSMIIQAQHKLFDNYYQFNSVIDLGVTLICALLLSNSNPSKGGDPAWCAAAIAEVGRAQSFIGSFCRGWPYARGMSRAFDTLATRIIARLSTGLADALDAHIATAANDLNIGTSAHEMPIPQEEGQQHPLRNDLDLDLGAALLLPNQIEWDEWINDSLVPLDDGNGMGDANMDTMLATIGQSPDWISAMVSGNVLQ